jgi:hypothetical protein
MMMLVVMAHEMQRSGRRRQALQPSQPVVAGRRW